MPEKPKKKEVLLPNLTTASNDLPCVTLITPTYNREDFLDETIHSVLQQDYPNIEYIVLDDGSLDKTREVLSKYNGQFYWESHPNMGETATVNKAIRMARGEIICVVNSDDPLLPGAVSTAVEYLRNNPKALAAYPDWLEIDENSNPIREHRLPDYTFWKMLREFNVAIGPGTFIRTKAFEIVGMRDPKFRYVGDLEFWYRLAVYEGLIHIPHLLATHRSHPSSASVSQKGTLMAGEIVGMMHKLFSNKVLPKWAQKMRGYSLSIAHHDAVYYCGSDRVSEYRHRIASFFHHPLAYIYRSAFGVDTPFRQGFYRRVWYFLASKGARLPEPPNVLTEELRSPHAETPVKFAFVSHVLPPSWSGQAVVIERLLNQLQPENYCLISTRDYSQVAPEENNRRLAGRYFSLPSEPGNSSTSRYAVVQWVRTVVRILYRCYAIAKIAKAEQCKVILAGTGDPIDLPAAFFASVLSKIPFIPYLFDDYTYQWVDPPTRSIAAWAEKIMFPRSAHVIVPNEFLRDEIIKRHGIVPIIIRNPSEDIKMYPENQAAKKAESKQFNLVYTGAVYHVNFGAFRNLIAAIEQMELGSYKLHLYTAQPISWLESEGIRGEAVCIHQHVPPDEVAEAQHNADILLIPFSFNSTVPEIIKTSAPGKMGDYLASATPILAHVPPNSFVSWYLRKYNCGIVVDEDNPHALAAEIIRFKSDKQLLEQIVHNALTRAKLDFHPRVSRDTLTRVLDQFA